MSGRVVVVGSINVDLVVDAPGLPRPGETVSGGSFGRHDGGKGGNQAVAAARFGARTAIVAALGDDPFGREAAAALRAEAVDTTEVVVVPGAATGVALIVVGPDGENQIAVAPGANAELSPDAAETALARLAVGPGDVVLVSHEIPTATVHRVLTAARGSGATSVLNPAPALGLEPATIALADVVTPNRSELEVLAAALGIARSTDLDRTARAVLEAAGGGSGPAVLVTLGADGARLVRTGAASVEVRPPQVRAVDTTGAGDALNGTLAARLAAGDGLVAAARLAVTAASLSTRVAGARRGMPGLEEARAAQPTSTA